MSFNLQWATFMDASNESALSRMWGGIHPLTTPRTPDWKHVGRNAFHYAETIVFPQWAQELGGDGFLPSDVCSGDFNGDGTRGSGDLILFLTAFGLGWTGPTIWTIPPSSTPKTCWSSFSCGTLNVTELVQV